MVTIDHTMSYICSTFSFMGTEIKQDMSGGFSSLLNVFPSVGTLKYEFTSLYCVCFYCASFLVM